MFLSFLFANERKYRITWFIYHYFTYVLQMILFDLYSATHSSVSMIVCVCIREREMCTKKHGRFTKPSNYITLPISLNKIKWILKSRHMDRNDFHFLHFDSQFTVVFPKFHLLNTKILLPISAIDYQKIAIEWIISNLGQKPIGLGIYSLM